jgi:hypothetical protein
MSVSTSGQSVSSALDAGQWDFYALDFDYSELQSRQAHGTAWLIVMQHASGCQVMVTLLALVKWLTMTCSPWNERCAANRHQ